MCTPPCWFTWSIAACICSWVISASATLVRKLIAIDWPIPELLPVIRTFFPRIPCIVEPPLYTIPYEYYNKGCLYHRATERTEKGKGIASLCVLSASVVRVPRQVHRHGPF